MHRRSRRGEWAKQGGLQRFDEHSFLPLLVEAADFRFIWRKCYIPAGGKSPSLPKGRKCKFVAYRFFVRQGELEMTRPSEC